MKLATTVKRATSRRGAILVLFGILLVVILGMVACALDVGWMLMTRTQLQAAADASALAAGTELLSGLGYSANRLPSEVVDAGIPIAVDYASRHRNGEVASSYADGLREQNTSASRDVTFGWATFNSGTGLWSFSTSGSPDDGWYNAARVTLHRDQTSSSNNDRPLPLILAPVLGHNTADLSATATVVILPAKGFTVEPGSTETANIMPFALRQKHWYKYRRAQYYQDHGHTDFVLRQTGESDAVYFARLQGISDYTTAVDALNKEVDTSQPLFGHLVPQQNEADDLADGKDDGMHFVQDFFDNWTCNACGTSPYGDSEPSTVSPGPDGKLELDAYPRDEETAGNFGTIDLGSFDNKTPDIARQIEFGLNAADFADMKTEGIEMKLPFDTQGDTGVSAGFKDNIERVIGQCRAIALFSSLTQTGNNADYAIVEWAGMRIMDVRLTGSMELKNLTIQLCNAVGEGSYGDVDDVIGKDTTVFTPLILID